MIIRKNDPNNKKIEEIKKLKKESGLGRGLDSLLEDNSPTLTSKTQVVRKTDEPLKRDNSLYRKDGALSYVKTPKRPGS